MHKERKGKLVFPKRVFTQADILSKKIYIWLVQNKIFKDDSLKMITNLVFLVQSVIMNTSQSKRSSRCPCFQAELVSSAYPSASDAFASEVFRSIKIKMPLPQLVLGLKSSATSGYPPSSCG